MQNDIVPHFRLNSSVEHAFSSKSKPMNHRFQIAQSIPLGDRQLLIDKSFLSLLPSLRLNTTHLRSIGQGCYACMQTLGVVAQRGSIIIMSSATVLNNGEFLFAYQAIAPIETRKGVVSGIINAPSDMVRKELRKIHDQCKRAGRWAKKTDMTRALFGVTLAHELSHALGCV